MVYRIMSFDGGGIRGVISAKILTEVEKQIQREYNQSLHQYFDMFVGTSTGSIIAAALANDRKSDNILNVYQTKGKVIFPYQSRWVLQRLGLLFKYGISAPKFSHDGLIKVLKEELGDLTLSDVPADKRLLITSYDTRSRQQIIFDNKEEKFKDISLRDACVCSSSAPTFFPAYKIKIENQEYSAIDGGVVANNPVAYGIAQALKDGHDLKDIQVLSIGTGDPTREISYEKATEWGAAEWALPIIDVMFDGASDMNNYIAEQILKDSNFLRLQFKLYGRNFEGIDKLNDDLDDSTDKNINNLIEATRQYLNTEEIKAKLNNFLEPSKSLIESR